jgi:CelD/BcsL family acetyltransferase involved in cellulose biosynthesis
MTGIGDTSSDLPYVAHLHGRHELDALGWPRAMEDGDWEMYVFQSREFLDTWGETIGQVGGAELYLVVIKDRLGRPVMYLPLCLEDSAGVRVIRFPDGGVADYNAPILHPHHEIAPDHFRRLWRRILALLPQADAIDLRKMPAKVAGLPNPMLALGARRAVDQSSIVDLTVPAEIYDADGARGAMLGQVSRKSRKADRKFGLHVQFGGDCEQLSAASDFIFHHKRRQYVETTGRDAFAIKGAGAFYQRLIAQWRPGGWVQFSVLTIGARIAAAHLGYETTKRAYYILPADDRANYGRFSCGTKLLVEIVRHHAARGRRYLDLGGGHEPYKAIWRTDTLDLYDHASPLTLKGAMYLAALRTARRLPGVAEALRRIGGGRTQGGAASSG